MSLDIKYSHPGELLKEKRLSKNLSLRGLSVKAGISHTEISKVESGERENPSYNTIFKICNALDLNFDNISKLFNIEQTESYNVSMDTRTNFNSVYNNRRLLLEKCTYSFLSTLCDDLSKEYDMYITPDMFQERYKLNGRASIPHLCFTKNDMVIGVDVRFMPPKYSPTSLHTIQSIKSYFADFYFNFRSSFAENKMLFFVCFVSESDECQDLLYGKYKDDFYKFMPILSTRLYNVDELLNHLDI
ncbi:MAG: helix-turn-helix domain-containing protein [Peptostreptococcaceae bacterium]